MGLIKPHNCEAFLLVFVRAFGQNTNPEPNSNPTSLTLTTAAFKPESNEQLQDAVKQCIHLQSNGKPDLNPDPNPCT